MTTRAAAVLLLAALSGAARADDGRLELRGDLAAETSRLSSLGSTASKTIEVARVAGGYALDDRFEVGGAYQLAVHDFEPGGIASAYGTWHALHTARLDVGASLASSVNLDADRIGDGRPRVALGIGAGVFYRITPCVSVFTGTPWGPAPLGQQIQIALGGGGFSTFDLPVGAAVTAFYRVDAYAMTTVMSVLLSAPRNDKRFAVLGKSVARGGLGVPLRLGARYGVTDRLKIGFELQIRDLEEPRAYASGSVTAVYRR